MSSAWTASDLEGVWYTQWYTTYTTVRAVILTPISYLFVVIALRLQGVRTMTGVTLFDKIGVVAVGAMLGGAVLRPNTPFVAYVCAVTLILTLQKIIDLMLYHNIIPLKLAQPTSVLLVARGRFIEDALAHTALTRDKIYSLLRQKGLRSLNNVQFVVLEGSGALSVIMAADGHQWHDTDENQDCDDLLENVRGYTEQHKKLR